MSKKDDQENLKLGLIGIMLGLVGIIISLVTPVIETSLKWASGTASGLEKGVMFIYIIMALILFVIELKVYCRISNMGNKQGIKSNNAKKYKNVIESVVVELAIIFTAIQINDYVPKSGGWSFGAMIILIIAVIYRYNYLE